MADNVTYADLIYKRMIDGVAHYISAEVRSLSLGSGASVTSIDDDDGTTETRFVVSDRLSPDERAAWIVQDIENYLSAEPPLTDEQARDYRRFIGELSARLSRPELSVRSIIIPEKAVAEGILVRATSVVWAELVTWLGKNWERAHEIPWDQWEELVAGAYKKADFDEVILTPRSGDFGRDVIAIKKGVGSIKILGSVKAYKPGHSVAYDDVRALLGVLSGDRAASKGIISTTSTFPPNIAQDPYIAPFLPTRLELMDGRDLQKWLLSMAEKK